MFGNLKINIMKIKVKYYEPIINYGDYQNRIFKNKPEIYWVNKVHEKIVGAMLISKMPYGLDLIHPKTIERQEKQNNFYENIN
jgi:hypothetical protein